MEDPSILTRVRRSVAASGSESNVRRALSGARRLDVSWKRWAAAIVLGLIGGAAQVALLGLLVTLAVTLTDQPQQLSLPFIGSGVDEIAGFVAALAMAVVLLIVEVAAASIITTTASQLAARRRERVIRSFFGANWDSQSDEREGSLQDFLFNHVGQVTAGFTAMAGGAVSTAILVSLVAGAIVVSPIAALILVGVTVALFVVLRPLTSAVHRRNRVLSAAARDYAQDVAETTGLTMEFRTLGVADVFESDQVRKSNHMARLMRRARFLERLGGTLFRNLTLLVVLATMGMLYGLDVASAPTLGLSLVLLLRSASYSQGIQNAVMFAGAIDPYLQRLEDFEDRMRTTAHRTGGADVDKIDELKLVGVDFSYTSENVLHEVSFTVRAGECVGIIGPSGSGKSTLTELLLRLREPTAGDVLINGHRGSEVADTSWYGQVGYVAQTPRLLTGTVADNIRFGRDLDEAAVATAARRAGLDDAIRAWSEGLETTIGPRSTGVSGGQRQRIALARALAAEPSILLLDEPTSSLDSAAEQLVIDTLDELKGTVTMVIVTHRRSALAPCDRLIELTEGRITFDGPYDGRSGRAGDLTSPARTT
jgi:ATP-binding cassette subfamily B protein